MSFTFEFQNSEWCICWYASIETDTKVTLLGILIDSELSFDQHISSTCSENSNKFYAQGRIATFMSFNKFWVNVSLKNNG